MQVCNGLRGVGVRVGLERPSRRSHAFWRAVARETEKRNNFDY